MPYCGLTCCCRFSRAPSLQLTGPVPGGTPPSRVPEFHARPGLRRGCRRPLGPSGGRRVVVRLRNGGQQQAGAGGLRAIGRGVLDAPRGPRSLPTPGDLRNLPAHLCPRRPRLDNGSHLMYYSGCFRDTCYRTNYAPNHLVPGI
ncbi:hypothetical protein DL771_000743 [Monosporascus sp. 5C6A]|nr:hypothetical protein DL771_000743 [Monosporascus sp. 5C6A]